MGSCGVPAACDHPATACERCGALVAVLVSLFCLLKFLEPPFFSRRLRALPTLLRVRLYVPEMAERGVGYNGAGARVFVCGGLLIFLRRVHAGCWL